LEAGRGGHTTTVRSIGIVILLGALTRQRFRLRAAMPMPTLLAVRS